MPPGKPASVTAWKKLERADRKRRRLAAKAEKTRLVIEAQLRRQQARDAAAAAKRQDGPPSLLAPCKALNRQPHCGGCGEKGHNLRTCTSAAVKLKRHDDGLGGKHAAGIRVPTCRACKKPGHARRQCSLFPPAPPRLCSLCGDLGHSHLTCTAEAGPLDATRKEALVNALLAAARLS